MRPIWKGSLAFGLVNIPVQLVSAVQAGEHISFRQLHKRDLSPIRYDRVCRLDGESVPWSEIVKGYEYEKDKYVVVTDADLKSVALESSKNVEIMDFVRADEVDPRYFETPYYLLPTKGGEKGYALLREAIRETGMIGIGKITMRSNSHHLVGIKVVDDALVLEIMRFSDELVDAGEFSFPAADGVRPQELQMARQLVENLAEPFDPAKYKDEYRERLMTLIKAKMKGKKLRFTEPEERERTQVVDLMARLQESLAQNKRRRPAARPTSGGARPRKSAAPRRRKTA